MTTPSSSPSSSNTSNCPPHLNILHPSFNASAALSEEWLRIPPQYNALHDSIQPTDNILKAALLLPFQIQDDVDVFKDKGKAEEGSQIQRNNFKRNLKQSAIDEVKASKRETQDAINTVWRRFTGGYKKSSNFLRVLYDSNQRLRIVETPLTLGGTAVHCYTFGKLRWFDKRQNVLLEEVTECWMTASGEICHNRRCPWKFIRNRSILIISKAENNHE